VYPSQRPSSKAIAAFTATASKGLVVAYPSPAAIKGAAALAATAQHGLSVIYPTPAPKGKP
jgi:hypothetical protein